jgi:hypothetical protein
MSNLVPTYIFTNVTKIWLFSHSSQNFDGLIFEIAPFWGPLLFQRFAISEPLSLKFSEIAHRSSLL